MPKPGVLALFPFVFAATVAQSAAEDANEVYARAVADFERAKIRESVRGFDRLAKLVPDKVPEMWQRGIALYYAGRYKDCRVQFESHRKVNPNDVENAAWHFLCVAREQSVDAARAALLPVGPDPRVPMSQIYQMFRGEMPPEKILESAGTQMEPRFYAYLYAGLYEEALGNANRCREYITAAADERFAVGGYMHKVARVHLKLLDSGK